MKKPNIIIFITFSILSHICGESLQQIDIVRAKSLAFSNNDTIKILRYEQHIIKRSYWMGFRQFFPQFSTSFNFSDKIFLYDTDTHSNYFTFDINQVLFDGGESIVSTILRNTELNILTKELLEKEKDLYKEVESLFYQFYFLERKIEVQKTKIQTMKMQLAIAKKEFELGMTTKIDYKDMEIKLNEEKLNLTKYNREYINSSDDFKELIGIDGKFEILPPPLEVKRKINLEDVDYLIQLAMSRRVDGEKVKYKLLEAKLKKTIQYLTFVPRVDMKFSYLLTGDRFPPNEKEWSLTFGVSLPLPGFPIQTKQTVGRSRNEEGRSQDNSNSLKYLDSLDSFNKFDQVQLALFKSKLEFDNYEKSVRKEVERKVREYNESLVEYQLNEERITLLEERTEILGLQLKHGVITRLDILKNIAELFKTKINLNENIYKLHTMYIEVAHLSGITREELNETIY